MQFSDTTNKTGLIQDCEMTVFSQYGAISDNSDKLLEFTTRINRAYDKVATLIMSADGRWQWDDRNYTTELPIGSTDLVSGQKDYTFAVEHLRIIKVIVKDEAGNSSFLKPVDIHDPEAKRMYEQTATEVEGIPVMYDKFADVIRLYPTPNYNYTNGLVVHFQREPSYFISTDTTKSAGIPSIFDRYLSLSASADYAITKQLNNKNDLFNLVQRMEQEIIDWYSKRSKDEQLTLRAKIRSSK